jgi:hypothetical protein
MAVLALAVSFLALAARGRCGEQRMGVALAAAQEAQP